MSTIVYFMCVVIIIVGVILKLIINHQRNAYAALEKEHDDLKTKHADQEADFNQRVDEACAADYANNRMYFQRRLEEDQTIIARLRGQVFRLPYGKQVRVVDSAIGPFAIYQPSNGYFGNTAIFVHFPIGFGFDQQLAKAFHQATNNEFVMEPAWSNSRGGDDTADAMITAGTDYSAFLKGQQGYFKESPPPELDRIAEVLTSIIVYPKGVVATS